MNNTSTQHIDETLSVRLLPESFSVAVIRRIARKHGLTLVRGRGQFSISNHLQFMLLDNRNRIIGGARYDMTEADVVDYLNELEAR